MTKIEEIFSKYSEDVINNLSSDNFAAIVKFLKEQNCDFIDDIVEDYLDLFILDISEFKEKFYILDKKYNGNFLRLARSDMNYLEEFFLV